MNKNLVYANCVLLALLWNSPAFAHLDGGLANGFVSGLTHPIFGWDHVVAMVAVGLWGAVLGAPAIWLLPIVFPVVMSAGAALGIFGLPLPFVELGIALSGVVLGLAVAFFARTPLALAAIIVGLFAIFHGYAHGAEMTSAYDPVSYGAGFVISTGLLHLAGILFGTLIAFDLGKIIVRMGGSVIALTGAAFLFGFL